MDDFRNLIEEVFEDVPRVPRRYIRDFANPFESYTDSQFKTRYRFDKECVRDVLLPIIDTDETNNRGLPLPALYQLLICLRFFATGSFQVVIGDLHAATQSTVSRIVRRVSRLLALQHRNYIKMPTTRAAKLSNRMLFSNLGKGREPNHPVIPGVEGAIDCTHIRLSHTKFGEQVNAFRNRKNYFSVNVQAVAGPRAEFLDIVASWAGSEHDSRIFQNSRIYGRYIQGELYGCLVGDAGYACQRFLLTPVANPVTDAERSYNATQRRARNVVERMFGMWKRRFPCLSVGLRNKLETVPNIIVACAVLHNIGIEMNDELPDAEENVPLVPEVEVPVDAPAQHRGGLIFRRALINRVFGGVN